MIEASVFGRQKRACRRAFTLTEIAIVLGIIGLILGAIWTAAARVYVNQRVNKAVTEVLTIANAVRATYSGKGIISSYSVDLTAAGISFGWFPQDMIQGATAVMPWGGNEVVVQADNSPGGAPMATNIFHIFIAATGTGPAVPPSECPAFLSALIPQAANSGLIFFFSDATGGFTITPTTPITDPHILNCGYNVVLSFQL